MREPAKLIFTTLILLLFSCLLFGQEMTARQKQLIERIEEQNKIEEQKQSEIESRLGINKQKKRDSFNKQNSIEFFWEKGVGLTTSDIAQKLDMHQYTQGGHIDCCQYGSADSLSLKCDMKNVRNFIWQQWTEKRRGYITISGDSVDYQGTQHIFIEPDDKDNWQIISINVRFQAISKPPFFIDKAIYMTSVNRVENNSENNEWTLILKDKSGKVVWELPYSGH